eukprot:m.56554 g.56554  ORF g.56554 m.56554 type:complete len:1175 (+) comp11566_c0_seq6:1231-4755(+)
MGRDKAGKPSKVKAKAKGKTSDGEPAVIDMRTAVMAGKGIDLPIGGRQDMVLSNFLSQKEQLEKPVPETRHELLKTITEPHLKSFNFMLNECLPLAVADLDPVTIEVGSETVTLSVTNCVLRHPSATGGTGLYRPLVPSQCRQRRISYKGEMVITIRCKVGSQPEAWEFDKSVGYVPIMVLSDGCHLRLAAPKQLVEAKEETMELGGYFVINGIEKIIRMLIMPRRNHPMCLVRPSFTKRGPGYTEFGVQIRCVRPDQTSQSLVVHYKADGTCVVGFSYRKQQHLIPAILLLRAFSGYSDSEIFQAIVQSETSNSFLVERVEILLSQYQNERLFSQDACLEYIGNYFKVVLNTHSTMPNKQAALLLFKRCLFVHIPDSKLKDKFDLLATMVRRAYALAAGECAADNADSQMNQEVLMPGQIYGALLKEQMQEYLYSAKKTINIDERMGRVVDFSDLTYLKSKVLARAVDIGRKAEYFLSTGNLASPTGLDQMQVSGFTIVAEKLNFMRYIAHFRCIHRGAFFSEMKTTAVRKLLPEAWGFLCPVHTPDGAPCGLLNHLTRYCNPQTYSVDTKLIPSILFSLGVVPLEVSRHKLLLDVLLDGVVVGRVSADNLTKVATQLRALKVAKTKGLPDCLEIAAVEPREAGQFPGLYLFSTPCRFIRPVHNLASDSRELISSFEQVYMDIAVDVHEVIPQKTTHIELSKHAFLSVVASFTPFSDFNQSPRNMYQCQMAKQTMGIPTTTAKFRADNKLYCLNSGQTPVVRPYAYDEYNLNSFPTGNNAIVCVVAYTGYDMEDAMIVNKSSVERGFMHARILTTKHIDLNSGRGGPPSTERFGLAPGKHSGTERHIDKDGLPMVGMRLKAGDPYYSIIDDATGKARIKRYTGDPATVEKVAIISNTSSGTGIQHISVTLSLRRTPIIGDKFASRAGQKGILSQLYPVEDMPFTESGIVPDILFNPHGFPSRMTIGMLIESMASKAGLLTGTCHDATPFTFSEEETAVEYFGEQLRKAGYNYYGHERMYSGITGEEFDVNIFIGNVFYQRLRHMVSDKFQVRTTGPVNSVTRQPVKGRKKKGGIRFGEMERDALLGHGTSFLLQDRLLRCSDDSVADVCKTCGCLLSTMSLPKSSSSRIRTRECRKCGDASYVVAVRLPYVFRYLAAELSAMNINLTLDVKTL